MVSLQWALVLLWVSYAGLQVSLSKINKMILEPLQKLIAGLLLLIVVFLSGFYIGHKQEKEKYDAYKSQMVAMANLQQEATKKTLDGQQKITKETVNEYETKLANLRSYFSRMLNNNTCTCPLPTLPNTTSEADEIGRAHV